MRRVLIGAALLFHSSANLAGQSPAASQQAAQAALQFEQSQIGHDCPEAVTTVDINACIAEVEAKTKGNVAAFVSALRSLLKAEAEAVNRLDRSQELWERYARMQCEAIDDFFRTGTIRFSAATGCRIELARSRMRDLDNIYYVTLHN
jgi:uncharacterized protein YecT (DUF1311 family)